jgi:HEAT repeat protein
MSSLATGAALLLLAAEPGDAGGEGTVEPPRCPTVAGCVLELEQTPRSGPGMSEDDDRLAKALRAAGPEAVPYLLVLLDHRRPEVRELAAYVLRDHPDLTAEHLPALLRAARREPGWLPVAIARIGTPGALRFLVSELVRREDADGELGQAFLRLGERGLPGLVRVLRCEWGCGPRLLDAVSTLLGRPEVHAAAALGELTSLAADPRAPAPAREHAVRVLGAIGPEAAPAAPVLRALAKEDPRRFADLVDSALAHQGGPDAEAIVLRRLRERPTPARFRELAELGERARVAGPELVAYLQHPDWDVVLGAARALGFVGATEAAPALATLFHREDDWRLSWAAAESLGKLRAVAALPVLREVAANHWFPPVRGAATRAIGAIERVPATPVRYGLSGFADEFFDDQRVAEEVWLGGCPAVVSARLERPPAPALPHAPYRRPGHGGELQEPAVALQVAEGWLLGAARGDEDGELVLVEAGGAQRLVLEDGLRGVVRMPGRGIVAVAGQGHRGTVYRVVRGPEGRYQALRWRSLPGPPEWARLEDDGRRMLVHCRRGSVLVGADGRMEVVPCRHP